MSMSDDMADMDFVNQIARLAMPEILSFLVPREKATFSEICRGAKHKVEKTLSSVSKTNSNSYEKGIKLALEKLKKVGRIKEAIIEPTYFLPR